MTDPSACSDLKGCEVRHQIRRTPTTSSLPPAGTSLKSRNRTWGPSPLSKDSMVGSISKNWRMKLMCWFSAEHVNKIEDAKAGQRLGIKKMHWDRNWVVGETELESPRPCPVCLNDQTRVLFRFSESQQASLDFGSEAEAVFRMLRHPKRDIFEFADGKQITGIIYLTYPCEKANIYAWKTN